MQLLDRARSIGWYHTLELAPDYATDGMFDLRPYVHEYGLPERMEGMRALDVGTWDGFWAFEMERRGAEVTALDVDDERELDWPPRRRPKSFPATPRGEGFRLAKEMLGSSVERVSCNLYEAFSSELGEFDLVFCGSILIHLRDQLLALERIAGLCRGTLIVAEEYDQLLNRLPFALARYRADRDQSVVFWKPNVKLWKHMIWTAGFDRVLDHGRFKMKSNHGFVVPHAVLHASDRVIPNERADELADQ